MASAKLTSCFGARNLNDVQETGARPTSLTCVQTKRIMRAHKADAILLHAGRHINATYKALVNCDAVAAAAAAAPPFTFANHNDEENGWAYKLFVCSSRSSSALCCVADAAVVGRTRTTTANKRVVADNECARMGGTCAVKQQERNLPTSFSPLFSLSAASAGSSSSSPSSTRPRLCRLSVLSVATCRAHTHTHTYRL